MATMPALYSKQDFPFLPSHESVYSRSSGALLGDSGKQSFPLECKVTTVHYQLLTGGILLTAIRKLARASESRRAVNAQSEKTRREFVWLAANRNFYARRWVALDGDRLLAVADSAKEVFDAIRSYQGKPLVTRVEPVNELPFGGW